MQHHTLEPSSHNALLQKQTTLVIQYLRVTSITHSTSTSFIQNPSLTSLNLLIPTMILIIPTMHQTSFTHNAPLQKQITSTSCQFQLTTVPESSIHHTQYTYILHSRIGHFHLIPTMHLNTHNAPKIIYPQYTSTGADDPQPSSHLASTVIPESCIHHTQSTYILRPSHHNNPPWKYKLTTTCD